VQSNPVVILAGARVPQMRQNGALGQATPEELSTLVASAAMKWSRLASGHIGNVYWGGMYQTEGASPHLPRYAAAGAGLGPTVPTALVNRLCGSGLEAVVQGSRAICLRETEAALVGSTDCMTRAASLVLEAARPLRGLSASNNPVTASTIDHLSGKSIAELAEDFAKACDIDRSSLDDFAFHSRRRASKAVSQGFFDHEIIPASGILLGSQHAGRTELIRDQVESRWPTRQSLAKIESPYGAGGRITRGNSSSFADGAVGLVLTTRSFARRRKCLPLATIRSWAVTAAPAGDIGGALRAAMKLALSRAELSVPQIDWIEIEEAFSVNCIHAIHEFSLPEERVNPFGGALALGHPPASSGLRQLLCAAHGLRHIKQRFALVALAVGGAQGMAIVIENEM
jgi:acetyl-CoA acetyltransferase family protein